MNNSDATVLLLLIAYVVGYILVARKRARWREENRVLEACENSRQMAQDAFIATTMGDGTTSGTVAAVAASRLGSRIAGRPRGGMGCISTALFVFCLLTLFSYFYCIFA